MVLGCNKKMNQDITEGILSLCFEYAKSRICAIWYCSDLGIEEVATGSLVKNNGKFYIVSAGHVVEQAQIAIEYRIVFHSGKTLFKRDVSETFSVNNEFSDVGVFELASIEEFDFYFEYMNFDFKFSNSLKKSYFLCGFPSEYVKSGERRRAFVQMNYAANFISEDSSFVYLEYPNTQFLAIQTTHDSGLLPRAFGLSGALIFEPSDFLDDQLWSPSSSKIFAIQSAYVDGKYLKSSKLESIRNYFEDQSN